MTDIFTKKKRSEVMSKIRWKWTKQEREYYEKNPKSIPHPKFPYKPDFINDGKVVFLDSTFWHGHIPQDKYDKMKPYWKEKLFRNIMRDIVCESFYGKYCERILVKCACALTKVNCEWVDCINYENGICKSEEITIRETDFETLRAWLCKEYKDEDEIDFNDCYECEDFSNCEECNG